MIEFGEIDLAIIRSNLLRISRTLRTGIVDTSSDPNKASLVAASATNLAEAMNLSLLKALEQAASIDSVLTPDDLVSWMRTINSLLTEGVMVEPGAYRTHPGLASLGYLDPKRLPVFVDRWSQVISRHVQDRVPESAVPAAIYWMVDIRGHLFADGCGKTSIIAAAAAEINAGQRVTALGTRNEHYSAAGLGPQKTWHRWRRHFSSLASERPLKLTDD